MIGAGEFDVQGKKYCAWVNNKVQALSMTIWANRTKDSRCLLQYEFFLDEIKHHYMDSHAGSKIWRAFRYLNLYLRTYPHASVKHQNTALAMLALIYGRLGFNGGRIWAAKDDWPLIGGGKHSRISNKAMINTHDPEAL